MLKYIFVIFFLIMKNSLAVRIDLQTFSLDLNLDEKDELLYLAKQNGLDLVGWKDHLGKVIFEHEFTPMGNGSLISEFTHLKLPNSQSCLMLNYREGTTGRSSLKKTSRLISLCFNHADLAKVRVQDLGYLFWDYQGVSAYQQLSQRMQLQMANATHSTAMLFLKSSSTKRSWNFDVNLMEWVRLPERRHASYGIRPTH